MTDRNKTMVTKKGKNCEKTGVIIVIVITLNNDKSDSNMTNKNTEKNDIAQYHFKNDVPYQNIF